MAEIERIDPASAPACRAQALAYLMFERPDLDRAADFFESFGLVVTHRTSDRIRLRAHLDGAHALEIRRGRRARFLGLGFEVADRDELERLALRPDVSSMIANDEAVGGWRVELTDPNGLVVHAVAGRRAFAELPVRGPLPINDVLNLKRVNLGQRPPAGPSEVLHLGHLVLNVVAFRKSLTWYMNIFGFLATDVLHLDDGSPAVVFLRCNRGAALSEHHTLVLTSHVETGFGHSAMKVADVDAVAVGADHLRARGFDHAWGIGRHLLGSQIFDYWRDPWGDKFEHYADSDVFDAGHPTGYHPLDSAGLYQWGPDLPRDFEDVRLTPSRLFRILKAMRQRDSELTLSRMLALKRAMSTPARPWMT